MKLNYKRAILLLIPWVTVILAELETPCSNYSESLYIPVVTFCANSNTSGKYIVLDGNFANMIPDIICNCIIISKRKQTIQFSGLRNVHQVVPYNCNSSIRVHSNSRNIGFHLNCDSTGSMGVEENEKISLTLQKTEIPSDTRYCLLIGTPRNSFDVTCFSNYITSPYLEHTTSMDKTEISEIKYASDDSFAKTTTSGILTDVSLSSHRNNCDCTARSSFSDEVTINGLFIAIAIGWILAIVSVVLNVIFLNQRRRYTRNQEDISHCNKYDDLQSQRGLSDYSSLGPAGQTAQEYEIVTNAV